MFYQTVVSATPFLTLETEKTEISTITQLSCQIVGKIFFSTAFDQDNEEHIDVSGESTVILDKGFQSQQKQIDNFMNFCRTQQRSRKSLILPHTDMVRYCELQNFTFPQMQLRFNSLNFMSMSSFAAQYIFGIIQNIGKVTFQSIVCRQESTVDDARISDIVAQYVRLKQHKIPRMEQYYAPEDPTRLNCLKIIYILSKNNIKVSQMFEKQKF